MSAFEHWTHGVAVQIETPTGITVTPTRYGYGTRLRASAKGGCWLHIAIPTPQRTEEERWTLQCTHIHLRARRSGSVKVARVHVRQGEALAYGNDAVAWEPGTTEETHTLTLSAQAAFTVAGPLVICLRAEWFEAGDLWVVGAGLRFREVGA